MKKILFISHVQDSSLSNGGAVFSSSVLRLIKAAFVGVEITECYAVSTNPILTRWFRKAAALARSFFSSLPSKSWYFRTQAFAARLRREMAHKQYDMVVIDHAEMLWVKDFIPEVIPIVHVSHNIEHLLYAQYVAKYSAWPGVGAFLARDTYKYMQFEKRKAYEVKNLITISHEDLTFWHSLGDGMNVIALNPVFNYRQTERVERNLEDDRVILGFLGNMEWWPNQDAIAWLKKNVLPYLAIPYELHLFGKGSEQHGNGRDIIGHGFVNDIAEVWRAVDIMVNPIVSGAGVNVKVAEALYNKVPTVCTGLALKGFHLVPDRSVVILDTPEQWINFFNSKQSLKDLVSYNGFSNADSFSFGNQTKVMQDYLGQVIV